MNVKKSLTRKLGPLPVWAWGALSFVGLYFYRNKAGAAATATDQSAAADQTMTPLSSNATPTGADTATGTGVDTSGTAAGGDLYPDSKLAQAVHNVIDTLNAARDEIGAAGATVPVGATGSAAEGKAAKTKRVPRASKPKHPGARKKGGGRHPVAKPRTPHPLVHPHRTAPSVRPKPKGIAKKTVAAKPARRPRQKKYVDPRRHGR